MSPGCVRSRSEQFSSGWWSVRLLPFHVQGVKQTGALSLAPLLVYLSPRGNSGTKGYPRGGGGEALLWIPTLPRALLPLPRPYPPWALPALGQVLGPLVAAVQHLCQSGRSCLLRAPSSNSDRWTSANLLQMLSPRAERVLAGRLGHRAALDFSSPVGSSHILPLPPLPTCCPL